MKRHFSTILSIGAVCVAAASVTTGALSLRSAQADVLSTDGFITPATYQQYLPMEEPFDVSVTDDFIAVADRNKVHVYSKTQDAYYTYTHSANQESANNRITKLQFDGGDLLYFLDATSSLYTFHPNAFLSGQTVEATATGLSCSAFVIGTQDLYFTNVTGTTNLSKTPLESLSVTDAEIIIENISSKPAIALDGNSLYYTEGSKYLNEANSLSSWKLSQNDTVFSVAVLDGYAYFTTDNDADFFVYDLLDGEIVATYAAEEGQRGYSAVTIYNGNVYVVKNQSVCEYSPATGEFTPFEMGASSTSVHRLSEGTDSVLCGDTLYIADKGAKRVSVYNTITKQYTTVNDTIAADYISTDGETVFLSTANAYSAALYDVATGETLLSLSSNELNGYIVGMTNVYGTYYFVTIANQYGRIEKADGEWTVQSVNREISRTPDLLTSDVYGDLYVMTTNGNVYRFSETEFMTESADPDALYTALPAGVTKLLVDYRRNVYALQGNTLHQYTPQDTTAATQTFSLGKTLAYTQTTNTPVTTVAFGAKTDTAYVLYNGNLMISTKDFNLPCMSNIATDGVDDVIFSEQNAQFTVVKTAENALLVEFDLNALDGAEVFPYQGYLRSESQLTALKIGETTEYALLAVFDAEKHAYHTYVVLNEAQSLTELPTEDYRVEYEQDEVGTGYLSSAANLYKFPYLTELLTVTQLPKNLQVTLLGEINQLDYDYYHVQFTTADGQVKTGYVPKSFINFFDGTPPAVTDGTYGESAHSTDSSWRFLYILLGCAAVIILVNFLILYPRKKDK